MTYDFFKCFALNIEEIYLFGNDNKGTELTGIKVRARIHRALALPW